MSNIFLALAVVAPLFLHPMDMGNKELPTDFPEDQQEEHREAIKTNQLIQNIGE